MNIGKTLLVSLALAIPALAAPQRIAIVKADDLRRIRGNWERFVQVSHEHGVNPSLGIILNSLENPDPKYEAWLKTLGETGKIEFWNHGWNHKEWAEEGKSKSEFRNSGHEHQLAAITRSQAAGLRVFGKAFTTFGSPYNDMDADTVKILNATTELSGIFCRENNPFAESLKGKVLMPLSLRCEYDGIGNPDFARFKEAYEKKDGEGLTVAALQFHPAKFNEKSFKEYAAILAFLKAEGWTFMLPSEYAESLE